MEPHEGKLGLKRRAWVLEWVDWHCTNSIICVSLTFLSSGGCPLTFAHSGKIDGRWSEYGEQSMVIKQIMVLPKAIKGGRSIELVVYSSKHQMELSI